MEQENTVTMPMSKYNTLITSLKKTNEALYKLERGVFICYSGQIKHVEDMWINWPKVNDEEQTPEYVNKLVGDKLRHVQQELKGVEAANRHLKKVNWEYVQSINVLKDENEHLKKTNNSSIKDENKTIKKLKQDIKNLNERLIWSYSFAMLFFILVIIALLY